MIGGKWEFAPDRQGETKETLADNTKAKELLGWEPQIAFEDGIAELKKINGIA